MASETRIVKSDKTRIGLLFAFIAAAGVGGGVMVINVMLFIAAISALILLSTRFGFLYSIMFSLISTLLCMGIYGYELAAVLILVVFLPGLIMGHRSRLFESPKQVVLWGLAPFILPLIFLIAAYPQLAAAGPELIIEMKSMTSEIVLAVGMSSQQMELLNSSISSTVYWILRLLPGIMMTMFISVALFGYLGASYAGGYFSAILPRFKPLYLWKIDEIWLLPIGLSLVMILLGGTAIKIIGENIMFFLVHLYAFFGICLVDYYLKGFNLPVVLRLIIYLLVTLVIFFAIPFLAFLGLIDSRFDFRKVNRLENTDNSEE